MKTRHSKTSSQQCRYYEVDNIFEYMYENLHQRQSFATENIVQGVAQRSKKRVYRILL